MLQAELLEAVCRSGAGRFSAPDAHQPFDGMLYVLGGNATPHRLADCSSRASAAPKNNVVSLDFFPAGDSTRCPHQADISNPVVAACMGASIEVDLQFGDGWAKNRFQVMNDLDQAKLGLRYCEVAEGLTGAGDSCP